MDTPEESGTPLPPRTGTGEFAVEPLIVPPPLSQGQVDKIIEAVDAVGNAAKAVGEAIQALGSAYGQYCRWVFRNFKPMLIPPIGPLPGTQEPSTPPPTSPP